MSLWWNSVKDVAQHVLLTVAEGCAPLYEDWDICEGTRRTVTVYRGARFLYRGTARGEMQIEYGFDQ